MSLMHLHRLFPPSNLTPALSPSPILYFGISPPLYPYLSIHLPLLISPFSSPLCLSSLYLYCSIIFGNSLEISKLTHCFFLQSPITLLVLCIPPPLPSLHFFSCFSHCFSLAYRFCRFWVRCLWWSKCPLSERSCTNTIAIQWPHLTLS